MNNPKVSVIIPIYNVERYVEKCVQSIIGQDYNNIEIILVNDGSPDKSDDIIRRMAAEDSRIVIVEQDNKGVSSARNAGIDIASGEWITFIDGDSICPRKMAQISANHFMERVRKVRGGIS